MENISTKIDDKDAAELAKQFESKYDGAKTAIEAYLALRNYALAEIRNVGFEQNELIAIVDCLNGTFETDARMQANTGALLGELEDFERLEGGIVRSNAKPDALLAKIRALTSAQVYFLQQEVYRWWDVQKPAELLAFVKLLMK